MSGFLLVVLVLCLTFSLSRSIFGLVKDIKAYREQVLLKRKLFDLLQVDYERK